MLITGDDILIEYVQRLKDIIKGNYSSNAHDLGEHHKDCLLKFISHYVWHCKDVKGEEINPNTIW